MTDAVLGAFGVPQDGFTTDGTDLFWTDITLDNAGAPVFFERLMRVPVDGGTAVNMAYSTTACSGSTSITAIAVDGTNVYFVVGGALWRIPKNSGPAPTTGGVSVVGDCMLFGNVSQLAGSTSGSYQSSNLATDGTNVFACGSANGPLEKAPVSGAPASVLTATQVQSDAIAVDGTSVYYWDAAGDLLSVSALVDGAAPITLAPQETTDRSFSLVVSGGFLYWSDLLTSSIRRVSTVGGVAPVVIASGNPLVQNVEHVAVDGVNAYWIGSSGPNNPVMRVSVNGGTPVPVAMTPNSCAGKGGVDCSAIAVDGTNVYWRNSPYIYKCAK